MDLQVLHVSQLYETVTTAIILILLITEILLCHRQLYSYSLSIRTREYEEQEQWVKEKFPDQEEAAAGPDLEKSAIESLRREITEYEKKNSQADKEGEGGNGQSKAPGSTEPTPHSLSHPQNPQQLPDLTPPQKSYLLLYLESNNFISQHYSIILTLLTLGMLTYTTRIYSLACFFIYLFGSLLFDFLHLEERLKMQYKRGTTVRRAVKVLAGGFLLGLFISYWALREYGGV